MTFFTFSSEASAVTLETGVMRGLQMMRDEAFAFGTRVYRRVREAQSEGDVDVLHVYQGMVRDCPPRVLAFLRGMYSPVVRTPSRRNPSRNYNPAPLSDVELLIRLEGWLKDLCQQFSLPARVQSFLAKMEGAPQTHRQFLHRSGHGLSVSQSNRVFGLSSMTPAFLDQVVQFLQSNAERGVLGIVDNFDLTKVLHAQQDAVLVSLSELKSWQDLRGCVRDDLLFVDVEDMVEVLEKQETSYLDWTLPSVPQGDLSRASSLQDTLALPLEDGRSSVVEDVIPFLLVILRLRQWSLLGRPLASFLAGDRESVRTISWLKGLIAWAKEDEDVSVASLGRSLSFFDSVLCGSDSWHMMKDVLVAMSPKGLPDAVTPCGLKRVSAELFLIMRQVLSGTTHWPEDTKSQFDFISLHARALCEVWKRERSAFREQSGPLDSFSVDALEEGETVVDGELKTLLFLLDTAIPSVLDFQGSLSVGPEHFRAPRDSEENLSAYKKYEEHLLRTYSLMFCVAEHVDCTGVSRLCIHDINVLLALRSESWRFRSYVLDNWRRFANAVIIERVHSLHQLRSRGNGVQKEDVQFLCVAQPAHQRAAQFAREQYGRSRGSHTSHHRPISPAYLRAARVAIHTVLERALQNRKEGMVALVGDKDNLLLPPLFSASVGPLSRPVPAQVLELTSVITDDCLLDRHRVLYGDLVDRERSIEILQRMASFWSAQEESGILHPFTDWLLNGLTRERLQAQQGIVPNYFVPRALAVRNRHPPVHSREDPVLRRLLLTEFTMSRKKAVLVAEELHRVCWGRPDDDGDVSMEEEEEEGETTPERKHPETIVRIHTEVKSALRKALVQLGCSLDAFQSIVESVASGEVVEDPVVLEALCASLGDDDAYEPSLTGLLRMGFRFSLTAQREQDELERAVQSVFDEPVGLVEVFPAVQREEAGRMPGVRRSGRRRSPRTRSRPPVSPQNPKRRKVMHVQPSQTRDQGDDVMDCRD